jgi:hypothetical protein
MTKLSELAERASQAQQAPSITDSISMTRVIELTKLAYELTEPELSVLSLAVAANMAQRITNRFEQQ